MNIATEPVQFSYSDRTPLTSRFTEASGKLWPAVQGVRALSRLDFHEDPDKLEVLRGRKARESFPLSFNAETGPSLSRSRRNPYVSDERLSGHVTLMETWVRNVLQCRGGSDEGSYWSC